MTVTIVSFGCPYRLRQDNNYPEPAGRPAYFQNGLAFVKALKDVTAAARIE